MFVSVLRIVLQKPRETNIATMLYTYGKNIECMVSLLRGDAIVNIYVINFWLFEFNVSRSTLLILMLGHVLGEKIT